MNYNKASYELILQTAINLDFEFVDFFAMDFCATHKRQIILRHDIDTSLAMAHEAAEIDAKCKVQATFALQISSPLYNPFTTSNIKIINGIHQLGHNIVLHHRIAPERTSEQIRQNIAREMRVMWAFFPYAQPVFVWHNPPANNPFSDIYVPGMINAYNAHFTNGMCYISDSILRHEPEDFLDVLDKHMFIQMLFHPTAWMSEKDSIVSMLACTLGNIIRECDHEFSLHPAWERKFPEGMPEEILNKLKETLGG